MLKWFCLIKFGKKEHLENLMNKGQMRFGSIHGFQRLNEKERGDEFEGMVNIVNGGFSKIECDHPTLGKHTFYPVPNTVGRLKQFTNEFYFCFSSYALTAKSFEATDNYTISDKMLAFGEYALIIKEPIIFFNQVKNRLDELGIKSAFGLIDYQDFLKEGEFETTLFTKTLDLIHQSEHRILLKAECSESALMIEIGSITDFCCIVSSKDLIATEFKAIRRQAN